MIAQASTLRVFAPDQQDDRLTLSDVYHSLTVQRLTDDERAPGTFRDYETTLDRWSAFFALQNRVEPDIAEITRTDLREFPRWLIESPAFPRIRSRRAANKHLTYVRSILADAAEDEEIDRLQSVPKGKPLRIRNRKRKHPRPTLDELSAIDRACIGLDFPSTSYGPSPVPLVAVWRAIFRILANLGPRRCELFLMPTRVDWLGENWPAVYTETEHPAEEIRTHSPFGWLILRTPKTERHKDYEPLILPLNRVTRDAFDTLLEFGPNRSRMLPISRTPTQWRKVARRIQRAAGIARPFTFQDFRHDTNSRIRAINADAARYISGHAGRSGDVNTTYYTEASPQAVDAVNRLEQPAAYARSLRE